MRRNVALAALAPLLALLIAAPRAARAFGVGYGFTMHQAELKGGAANLGRPARIQYPVHKITVIDTTGLLASVIASARYDVKYERTPSSITKTETWSGEYTPMSEGVRVRLAYGWSNGERDTQVLGEPKQGRDTEFSEFELTVGGLLNLAPLYVDLDVIDLVWRDLGSDVVRLDRFLWSLDLEVGYIKGPLRFGGRVEYDLFAAVDAIFDDAPSGYAYGLAAHWDYYPLIITAQWMSYRNHTGPAEGGFGEVQGRLLSLGATAEF